MTEPPELPPVTQVDPASATRAQTLSGAAAFATWFIELYPYVYNTGDAALLEAHSLPECDFCSSVAEGVQGDRATGVEHAYGPVTVTRASAEPRWWGNDPHEYVVSLTMVQDWSEDRGADGAVVARSEPTRYHVSMAVVQRDGEWWTSGVSAVAVQDLPLGNEPLASVLPDDVVTPGDAGTSAGTATTVRYALLRAYAAATGDLGPMTALEDPSCRMCPETHGAVSDLAEADPPVEATVRVEGLHCWTGDPLPWVECNVWIALTDPHGAVSRVHDVIQVTWDGTRWAVTRTYGIEGGHRPPHGLLGVASVQQPDRDRPVAA